MYLKERRSCCQFPWQCCSGPTLGEDGNWGGRREGNKGTGQPGMMPGLFSLSCPIALDFSLLVAGA